MHTCNSRGSHFFHTFAMQIHRFQVSTTFWRNSIQAINSVFLALTLANMLYAIFKSCLGFEIEQQWICFITCLQLHAVLDIHGTKPGVKSNTSESKLQQLPICCWSQPDVRTYLHKHGRIHSRFNVSRHGYLKWPGCLGIAITNTCFVGSACFIG